MTDMRFKRVLLKLSGEAIAKKRPADKDGSDKKDGRIEEIFDGELIDKITDVIGKMTADGVQVGIVIGAGNIWRGALAHGVNRARADHMGMLATMINCLRLEDALEKKNCKVTVMTPIQMNGFAETYDFKKAVEHLEEGSVVIFGAGTGIPFVSTDTAAVVRAAEIDADVILMAKNVDGIYTCNPDLEENKGKAKKYRTISYDKCLKDDLHATDVAASALAEEQGIDMYVFGLSSPENILRVVNGEEIGTFVSCDKNTEAELY